MADLAISAAQALVVAVIYIAETIKAAIDEADVLITDMPLVEAGLVTVRDALTRNLTLNDSVKKNLHGYVERVTHTLNDAKKTLEEVHDNLESRRIDYKGAKANIERVKKSIAKNKFFFEKKAKLQAIHQSFDQAKVNLDFILKLIATGSEYDPTDIITDAEGRQFWQKHFGKVRSVKWNDFFESLKAYCSTIKPPVGGIAQHKDGMKRVIDNSGDDEISPYEFQQFLNWFAPLPFAAARAGELGSKSYFCGGISGELADEFLDGLQDGAFLVRWSVREPGKFVGCYRSGGKSYRSLIYNHGQLGCSFSPDASKAQDLAPNIPELLRSRPDVFQTSAMELRARQAPNEEFAGLTLSNSAVNLPSPTTPESAYGPPVSQSRTTSSGPTGPTAQASESNYGPPPTSGAAAAKPGAQTSQVESSYGALPPRK